MRKNYHQKLKQRVYRRDGYTCQLGLVGNCAGDMSELYRKYLEGQITRRRALITVDHVRPISKGGAWEIDNLVCACTYCNRSKGDTEIAGVRAE